jgi:hypothetical protein
MESSRKKKKKRSYSTGDRFHQREGFTKGA